MCFEALVNAEDAVAMYQCSHSVCKMCSGRLIEHDTACCPCCRADRKPHYNFCVHIVTGERQLYWTDAGTYRVADAGTLLASGTAASIQELLPFLNHQVVFGVRFVEGTVGYVVYGSPGPAFLDLLALVPEASHNTRDGRHLRIEMGRVTTLHTELISGYGLSPVDFVRTLQFPVAVLDVADADDEIDPSDSESETEY